MLNIGTTGVQTPAPQNPNNNSGVAGAQAQSCSSPRLSFSLSHKPLRISKGTPVLQTNKRYRFAGRLTCVINGKRVSAPKSTRIEVLNKVGSKTVSKPGHDCRAARSTRFHHPRRTRASARSSSASPTRAASVRRCPSASRSSEEAPQR